MRPYVVAHFAFGRIVYFTKKKTSFFCPRLVALAAASPTRYLVHMSDTQADKPEPGAPQPFPVEVVVNGVRVTVTLMLRPGVTLSPEQPPAVTVTVNGERHRQP